MRALLCLLSVSLLSACGPAASPEQEAGSCGLDVDGVGQFVTIPAGILNKGRDAVYPEEASTADIYIEEFLIQAHEVTNDQFSAFVQETGYVTAVEQGVIEKRPGAGSAIFRDARWYLVSGASWRAPDGPGSSVDGKGLWPVVHVSLADAKAYAAWAGGRIPSEEEWEHAARLGLPDPERDTSGAFEVDGSPRANTWQGIFPVANTGADGFSGASPAGCFPKDRLGLYDVIGNVWEWTDTPFSPGNTTIKGGSYLCADNFCRRYRPAARHPQESDFSSNHIGFRIAKDPDSE